MMVLGSRPYWLEGVVSIEEPSHEGRGRRGPDLRLSHEVGEPRGDEACQRRRLWGLAGRDRTHVIGNSPKAPSAAKHQLRRVSPAPRWRRRQNPQPSHSRQTRHPRGGETKTPHLDNVKSERTEYRGLQVLARHHPVVDHRLLDRVGLGLSLGELALHGNDDAVHEAIEPADQLGLGDAERRG